MPYELPRHLSPADINLSRQGPQLALDDAPMLNKPHWNGTAQLWRPRIARELVQLTRRGEFTYVVKLRGPLLTSKGAEHASRTTDASYGPDEVPEWLAPQLQGPQALYLEMLDGILSAPITWSQS
jgi:hypothetical protein